MEDAIDRLLEAIEAADTETIKALAPGVFALEAKDLLHYAVQLGNLDVLKTLLDSGGIKWIDAFDDLAFTPLIWAAKCNSPEMVRLLLHAGAAINTHNEAQIGNTALREVIETATLEMVQLLIDSGADPTIPGWMQLSATDKAQERVEKEGTPTAKAILAMLRTSPA